MEPHWSATPFVVPLEPPQKFRGQDVVPATEDVGPDLERFPDRAFDREAPAVHAWVNILEMERASRLILLPGTYLDLPLRRK